MIEILKQFCLWLFLGGLVLWICTALALIESMNKDKARRRRTRRTKRGVKHD